MARRTGFAGAAVTIATMTAVGCRPAPAPPQTKAGTTIPQGAAHRDASNDGDDHEHGAGPHDGTLADWGGGTYHVEFTVDHARKEAVVYVLGTDMKTPAPVKTADGALLLAIREPPFQVELESRPLAGETDGRSSRYGGTHDSLAVVRPFTGTVSGEVDGTPFAGDFSEGQHDARE